jgi:flagellin-like protein
MKGISPFISTILLIAITVAVAGMIGLWITTLTHTQTGIVGNKTEEDIDCRYAGIKIDDSTIQCNFAGSSDQLNFTLENTGTVDMYNFNGEIYLGGLIYSYSVYNPLTNLAFNSTYPIRPGESKTVVVNITDNLASSNPTWIRVVSRCPTVYDTVENVGCT